MSFSPVPCPERPRERPARGSRGPRLASGSASPGSAQIPAPPVGPRGSPPSQAAPSGATTAPRASVSTCASPAGPQLPPPAAAAQTGEWVRGRATFYDGPRDLKRAFAPLREGGESAWGDVFGGSCGYVDRRPGGAPQSNADFPWPVEGAVALSDRFPLYEGSCGQCLEVRCRDGPVPRNPSVPGDETEPVAMQRAFLPPADPPGAPPRAMWEALPGYADRQGRSIPPRSVLRARLTGTVDTSCWPGGGSVRVRVVDSCPCVYCPRGGPCRRQENCCAEAPTLDLSYWAYERLAHPSHGMIGVDWRPVDCATGDPRAPDPRQQDVSRLLTSGGPRGWALWAWGDADKRLLAPGTGRAGEPSTCLTVAPGGGLALYCRRCQRTLRPIEAAAATGGALELWARRAEGAARGYAPVGAGGPVEPPALKVVVSRALHDEAGSLAGAPPPPEVPCARALSLETLAPVAEEGAWRRYAVPVAAFGCPAGLGANKVVFQDTRGGRGSADASFCLADVALVPGGGATAAPGGGGGRLFVRPPPLEPLQLVAEGPGGEPGPGPGGR